MSKSTQAQLAELENQRQRSIGTVGVDYHDARAAIQHIADLLAEFDNDAQDYVMRCGDMGYESHLRKAEEHARNASAMHAHCAPVIARLLDDLDSLRAYARVAAIARDGAGRAWAAAQDEEQSVG